MPEAVYKDRSHSLWHSVYTAKPRGPIMYLQAEHVWYETVVLTDIKYINIVPGIQSVKAANHT